MVVPQSQHTVERERQALNGWLALALVVLWFIAAIAVFLSIGSIDDPEGSPGAVALRIVSAVLMIGLGIFCCFGFFTLEPNEARVLILFGAYKGTVRSNGFHWANPLYARNRGAVPGSTPVAKTVKVGPVSMSDGTMTRPKRLRARW